MNPIRKHLTEIIVVATVFVLMALLVILPGCQAHTSGVFVGRQTLQTTQQGFVYTYSVDAHQTSVADDAAVSPTTQSVGWSGVSGEAAGAQRKTAQELAAERQAGLFGWAAIAATIAAVLLVWPARNYILAAGVGVAALVFYSYQTLQNPLVFAGLLGSIAFLGWYALRRRDRLVNGQPVTTATDGGSKA